MKHSVRQHILLYAVCLMLFIDAIGEGLIYPILPELFNNSNLGLLTDNVFLSRNILYGVSLSLFPLACIFGMPLLGSMSDKYGRKKIILYGISGMVFSYFLSTIAVLLHNLWLFFLSVLLSGFFSGTYSVGSAIISHMSDNDEERISNFKLPTLASLGGFIIGPSLSIFISWFSFYNPLIMPFILASILGIINLGLFLWAFSSVSIKGEINNNTLSVDRIHSKSRHNSLIKILILQIKSIFKNVIYAFSSKKIRGLSCSYLLFEFGYGLFVDSISLRLSLTYNYVPNEIGIFFLVISLFMIASMYLIQPLMSKYIDYITPIEFGLTMVTILIMLSLIWHQVIANRFLVNNLYSDMIIIGGYYLFNPIITLGFTNLFANRVKKEEQGKIMGISWQIWSIARFISGLIIGSLIANYYLILSLIAGSFLLSYVVLRREI